MITSVLLNSSSLRRLVTGAAVFGALSLPTLAAAQTTTFETLGYGPACEWGGGASFSTLDGKAWGGFRPLDLNNLSSSCGRSTNTGYASLLTSNVGNVIATGSQGAWVSSANPFTLNSLVAGAGWLNPTKLTLDFFLNGVFKSSSVIQLDTYQTGGSLFTGFYAGPTDYIGFTPDYGSGVDVFNSKGESCAGAGPDCIPETYKTWFVDNMSFSPAVVVVTPEPSTTVMMVVGLVAVGGVVRRRRRQAGR